ncbi:hypothetical protein [Formosa sp. 4Alg 33]|uniref:hypothetical protein n=1 Tax=Formosa sp. 4Alg 33 TaxID=3382189 RepID=UPI003D9C430D
MSASKIDILNIFLIFISLFIAIKIPFELFIFSYAALGPLHYLTEINWLHQKNYFISSHKNWSIILIVLTILISIYPIVKFSGLGLTESAEYVINLLKGKTKLFLLIGFLFAISLIFLKSNKGVVIALVFIIFFSFITITFYPKPFFIIGALLPTLIHVYVFTLFFIFYGALKSRSKYGFYLGIILFTIPFIISYIPIKYLNYNPSEETIQTFFNTDMISLSEIVSKLLNGFKDDKFLPLSELGIRIEIFIAFAYTYHYLNWFSKTSIIGWKDTISKQKVLLILLIWVASVGLYIYDFKIGLIALFFLSYLHVLLELPLNLITIKGLLFLSKFKRN